MPQRPNKLSQFWQELKRRRVAHVITVYASAAWVLIQLVNNLMVPLNLPTGLSTIVIIVLAVGFPLVIILSWIYDLTSEGIEKTKPLSEIYDKEKTVVPNAWKIATYVSFVVIIGLVTFNIFKGTDGLRSGDIQSLAILPFDNYTGDEQLDYVAAGLHSFLVGDTQKLAALRVTGKTSSSIYKDTDKSAPEIAKELNVDALVEPMVTCYGDSICIQIKVITMYPEEKQLFVEEYNVDKSEVLNLYSKITKKIAKEMMVELAPEEERLLAKSRTVDKEAYDEFLMGVYLLEDLNLESLNKAREYLNSAIEKDPDWAPLYANMAGVWMSLAQMNFEPPGVAGPKIFENLNKALELDPDNFFVHSIIGQAAFLTEWDWKKAEMELLKALATNPNEAMSRALYAHLLGCLQRPDEALTQVELAIELDPLNPIMQVLYGAVLVFNGEYESGLVYGEKITADKPGNLMANSLIEVAAFNCRDYNKVIEAAKNILTFQGVDFKEVDRIFGETGFVAAYEEILRQYEVLAQKQYVQPTELAMRYMMVDQPDKAIEWLEKGYEVRDPVMPYLGWGYLYEPLFDNPRFIEILQKMNLPLPTAN